MQGPFDVADDAENGNKVNRAWGRHELTHDMNSMADVGSSDSEIVETSHKLSI
ncbi:hypothetical protein LguiB_003981 [Lonicera macranthoides]